MQATETSLWFRNDDAVHFGKFIFFYEAIYGIVLLVDIEYYIVNNGITNLCALDY